jgi:uncharacterized small protein (DUF1192 family)
MVGSEWRLDDPGLSGGFLPLNLGEAAAQEAIMDEDDISKPKSHEVGMVLDAMSAEELQDRIGLLEQEIARLRRAIEARGHTRKAAESIFKL